MEPRVFVECLRLRGTPIDRVLSVCTVDVEVS